MVGEMVTLRRVDARNILNAWIHGSLSAVGQVGHGGGVFGRLDQVVAWP